MKIISLFCLGLNVANVLFSASSSSESKFAFSVKSTSQDIQSRLELYPKFHQITQGSSRLYRLEIAKALLDKDTRAATESIQRYASVRYDLQKAGIEISGEPAFKKAEDDIDLSRRAARMSRALLLDVILLKNLNIVSCQEPSDEDLQESIRELTARPFTPESEPFVEAFWEKKESIELAESTYKISSIHPLPRKEPGCAIM